ncbi:response regulator transcription factor, partial [bacterium]|nr:response regulator transcription factor [bacterium]
MIKVLIAENDAAEREKLRNLLADETDIEVVGEAGDGKECLDLTVKLRPQIVLVKRDLPVINGLDVAEQIAVEMPASAAILILSGNEEEDVWHKMLRAGIRDFVSRPIAGEQLLEELRRVATAQS